MSEKIIITKADRAYELWKVEITDKNGYSVVVYEPTIADAFKYTQMWLDSTEYRQLSHEIQNKAIESFLENERKAGRTSGLD